MTSAREDLLRLMDDPASFLTNADPVLRRIAVSALVDPLDSLDKLRALADDDAAPVRAAVADRSSALPTDQARSILDSLGGDDDPRVREAVATAYGEIGDASAVDWLESIAELDPDRHVREAAVASLGAIGEPRSVDTLLTLLADGPPPVRRRAVAAITVFDDPRVEPALRRAALDKNPGVREAAEMVVGRQIRES